MGREGRMREKEREGQEGMGWDGKSEDREWKGRDRRRKVVNEEKEMKGWEQIEGRKGEGEREERK